MLRSINGPVVGSRPLATMLEQKDVETFAVGDADASAAMRLAFDNLKLVLEPAGAASLAAVTLNKERFEGSNVVIVGSGGNVDASVFAAALRQDSLERR